MAPYRHAGREAADRIGGLIMRVSTQSVLAASVALTAALSVAVPAVAVAQEVHYANCSEVRAAGKAPLLQGQPGYADHLDRDHDGVACEVKK